ncbi:MAG: glycosyltransferase [bacterium]|nr:glycosyltransferase [bacterium]
MSADATSLRVLLTNGALAIRAGTELWVRDVALALQARGHRPVVYSPVLGELADELRRATVPVVSELGALATPPDVIHGHHHLETMSALLRFPGVPAISVCHGWLPWQEAPPLHPRIHAWVAVDEVCRDRLVCEHGIAPARTRLLLNFVDLHRFPARATPPPTRPQRALVFGYTASEDTWVPVVRAACARAGVPVVDVVGYGAGNPTPAPEALLPRYDLVFAKARSALEALAVGAGVILCDARGTGGLVTSDVLAALRRLNLGVRTLGRPLTPELLAAEIARWNAADVAEVSRRVRAEAGLDAAIDVLEGLYREAVAAPLPVDAAAEGAATASYLAWLGAMVKQRLQREADALARERHDGRLAAAEAAGGGARRAPL